MTVCVCSVLGTPFYLMEHVQGRIFKDPSLPGLRPEERSQVYAAMNRTIATIHAVDVDAAGLADYGKHGEYVLRQVREPGHWTPCDLFCVSVQATLSLPA